MNIQLWNVYSKEKKTRKNYQLHQPPADGASSHTQLIQYLFQSLQLARLMLSFLKF